MINEFGTHFSCFYIPEDVKAGKPETEFRVATSRGHFQGQEWRVRKDGSRFWANVAMTAIRDGSGALVGYGVITRELTVGEKFHTDSGAALQAENAVVVVDQEGRIVLVNSRAEELFGYARGDLLSTELTEPKTEQRPPKAVVDGSAGGAADSEFLNVASVTRNTSSRGVLVVDDDVNIRYSLVEALEDEGYRALSASNGVEALEVLRVLPKPPSVILLDLMMPVMDGWEFRAQQQRDPVLSKIPVVVISAHANVVEEAAQVSASAYLVKPFQLEDLVATVGKVCSSGA